MAERTPLEQLARVLAKNYFDTSQTLFTTTPGGALADEAANTLRATGRQVFTDDDAEELAVKRPERIVLVVGAGASFGAFGDAYPGTAAAVQRISGAVGLVPPAAAAEGEGPGDAEGASPAGQFETALAALVGEFGDARIRAELVRMYGERHHPHLGFEIIAHLFKHRFIDVIINFNFDELLDEAIEGEMGTAEYHHVLFEGQCQGLAPLLVDRRLKIPLYIKPNGTVSHPSSMRFTREPHAQLPEPMHNLLAQIIGGHWENEPRAQARPNYQPYGVNLITIGFSMESVPLLKILQEVSRERKHSGITLFHLNQGRGLDALRAAAETRGWSRVTEEFIDVDRRSDADEGKDAEKEREAGKGGLAETLRALWNAVGERFHKPFRPRGIARHEIVHNLFFAGGPDGTAGTRVPGAGPDGNRNLYYFQARLYAEVAMALARGNGQIDLGTMAESRVGVTFELMRSCKDGRNISIHQILQPFSRGGNVEFSGRDNSVYRFQYEQARDAARLNDNLARELWECLLDALRKIPDPDFEYHLDDMRRGPRARKMVDRFRRLASSDAQDISPAFSHRHLLLSREPQAKDVIHTSLGLTLRFVEMLNQSWDLMLAMSENGKVMSKYQRHVDNHSIGYDQADKRFCLILAKNDHPEVAEARLQRYYPQMLGLTNPPVFYIPAWAHNQHMVLLLKRNGREYTPVSAVRYETPRLGNRVNPVFIRSRADLDAALECFKRYLHMSVCGVLNGSGNTEADDALLRREVDELWDTLVKGGGERPPAPPEPGSTPTLFG